eukprot:gb/GEZN01009044.1/.p1 GENE.gb/GEZN01009044.1/~~gb/GEZN01009044.1/.p1  ORF type:complete len:419 (+),score=-1.98 gb/GEZN01009044.1/:33-1289(+)
MAESLWRSKSVMGTDQSSGVERYLEWGKKFPPDPASNLRVEVRKELSRRLGRDFHLALAQGYEVVVEINASGVNIFLSKDVIRKDEISVNRVLSLNNLIKMIPLSSRLRENYLLPMSSKYGFLLENLANLVDGKSCLHTNYLKKWFRLVILQVRNNDELGGLNQYLIDKLNVRKRYFESEEVFGHQNPSKLVRIPVSLSEAEIIDLESTIAPTVRRLIMLAKSLKLSSVVLPPENLNGKIWMSRIERKTLDAMVLYATQNQVPRDNVWMSKEDRKLLCDKKTSIFNPLRFDEFESICYRYLVDRKEILVIPREIPDRRTNQVRRSIPRVPRKIVVSDLTPRDRGFLQSLGKEERDVAREWLVCTPSDIHEKVIISLSQRMEDMRLLEEEIEECCIFDGGLPIGNRFSPIATESRYMVS